MYNPYKDELEEYEKSHPLTSEELKELRIRRDKMLQEERLAKNQKLFEETIRYINPNELDSFLLSKDTMMKNDCFEDFMQAFKLNAEGGSFEVIKGKIYKYADFPKIDLPYYKSACIDAVREFLRYTNTNNNRDRFEELVIEYDKTLPNEQKLESDLNNFAKFREGFKEQAPTQPVCEKELDRHA